MFKKNGGFATHILQNQHLPIGLKQTQIIGEELEMNQMIKIKPSITEIDDFDGEIDVSKNYNMSLIFDLK